MHRLQGIRAPQLASSALLRTRGPLSAFRTPTGVVLTENRQVWGTIYKLMKMRDQKSQAPINSPDGVSVAAQDPQDLRTVEGKEDYVNEKLREMLYNMNTNAIPKGVWFSTLLMSLPFLTQLGQLVFMAPMAANAAVIDPN